MLTDEVFIDHRSDTSRGSAGHRSVAGVETHNVDDVGDDSRDMLRIFRRCAEGESQKYFQDLGIDDGEDHAKIGML